MVLDEMWEQLSTRLEGRIVVLDPLGPQHAEALRSAGEDPQVWRWMRVSNVDDWLNFAAPGIRYGTGATR